MCQTYIMECLCTGIMHLVSLQTENQIVLRISGSSRFGRVEDFTELLFERDAECEHGR